MIISLCSMFMGCLPTPIAIIFTALASLSLTVIAVMIVLKLINFILELIPF